jgi:hypothetical protein
MTNYKSCLPIAHSQAPNALHLLACVPRVRGDVA